MTNILADQAMRYAAIGSFHREVGTVANNDQTLLSPGFVKIGINELCALVKALPAAFLDLPNTLDLTLRKPPFRPDQGLKW